MSTSDCLLEDAGLSRQEAERLRLTARLVPAGAHNGLEIGFRHLLMTRLLRQRLDLVSVDLPHDAKDPGGNKLAFADIQQLPFRDNSFDIVVCTEVLEHLSEPVLSRGVGELERVSREYLLLSVPYRQRVWNELAKCERCGAIANSMDHVHSFDEAKISSKFRSASPTTIEFVGTQPGYAPDWIYRLSNRAGNAWCDFAYHGCPNCGPSFVTPAPNLIGQVLRRIIWRWEARVPTRHAWVLMLLRKQ